MLHVMSFYGIPNSETEADAYHQNEHLLGLCLEVASELGNVPVIIGGDFNITPECSAVLRASQAASGW
eukprot:5013793-Karenia_brevis.AAC.1